MAAVQDKSTNPSAQSGAAMPAEGEGSLGLLDKLAAFERLYLNWCAARDLDAPEDDEAAKALLDRLMTDEIDNGSFTVKEGLMAVTIIKAHEQV
jgi:hypothetical protein